MKNLILFFLSSTKNEKDILVNNRVQIEKANHDMLKIILLIGFMSFFTLTSLSFFLTDYVDTRWSSITMLFVILLFALFAKYKAENVPSSILLYFVYAFAITYAIFTSSVTDSDHICIIILAFMFEIPFVILDRSKRVNLFACVCTVIYLLIVIPNKLPSLRVEELINVCLFDIVALPLGNFLRKTRLFNLELTRQGMIRETTDYLTGLGNRRKLYDKLKTATSQNEFCTGIAMIDIDKFKIYNDTYGHQAGDTCLTAICNEFLDFSNQYPVTFYRYGGEEFLALFEHTNEDGLLYLCKLLKERIEKMSIRNENTESGQVTISIGLVVNHKVRDTKQYEILLSYADKALYCAKNTGRNKVVVYQSEE